MQLAYGYGTTANSSWAPNMTKRNEKLNMIKKTKQNVFQIWYVVCNYWKRLTTGNQLHSPEDLPSVVWGLFYQR